MSPEDAAALSLREATQVLARLLYRDAADIEPDLTFWLLGVDALLGAQFVALLNAACGSDVDVAELDDYPTPAALSRHVAAQLTGTPPPRPLGERAVPEPRPVPAGASRAGGGRADVLSVLREQLAETLCCDVFDIDTEATFRSLGLDPVLGAEFLDFVNGAYGIQARPAVLFDHPSLSALADHIAASTTAVAPGPSAAWTR
ncbi:acyl carrier protein [Streptomyces sp. NBC_00322]|uniref:acyl carrier protein n=1 Tax=Streptomyces sp. NBC_00322 TaxID=2975712 RepID=UPI002E2D5B9F|nr:acyl carrier protein [Streptomyces sp. NBC_00322]